MSDENTPDPRPENAYPPPGSAYPNQSTPPPADPPASNPYGTSDPYGTNSQANNPYGTGSQAANPYGPAAQTPQTPYGSPAPNPQEQYGTSPQYGAGYSTPDPQANWPPPAVGPYNTAGGQPYSPVNGSMILTLGILSFFCVGIILGPIAWVMGNNGLKTLDQYGDPLNQRGNVSAGRICGMIATILTAIGIVFYILYIIFIIGVVGFSAAHPSL